MQSILAFRLCVCYIYFSIKLMEIMDLVIFLLVYLGMILGSWPGLALDRTGIALLGAIAFIELQGISIPQAAGYIDFSTLAILFSFMIISAQFYFSGFYTYVVDRMEKWNSSYSLLLLGVLLISFLLSAVLINDIVCLALTPLVIRICFRKQLNPLPFLIGLACSSNIGSALTLIGNPQNMLIGQAVDISFIKYLKFSCVPCILSLIATWLVISFQNKLKGSKEYIEINPTTIPFDLWQSCKGAFVILILLMIFLFTDLPREKVSLVAAGFLLLSRQMTSQKMLGFIDWQLLVLFVGLFIVNNGLLNSSNLSVFIRFFEDYQVDMNSSDLIVLVSLILSNIVSNVPAVMLLLPFIKTDIGGSLLALSSTFAGNLFLVGSISNLIVVSQASQFGVRIHWKDYAKIGFPVSALSFAIVFGWLYIVKNP